MSESVDAGNAASERLRQHVAKLERLEEEKASVGEDIKAAFGAAKVDGFDPKVLRLVLRLRKLRPDEREEQTALVETYLAALGM